MLLRRVQRGTGRPGNSSGAWQLPAGPSGPGLIIPPLTWERGGQAHLEGRAAQHRPLTRSKSVPKAVDIPVHRPASLPSLCLSDPHPACGSLTVTRPVIPGGVPSLPPRAGGTLLTLASSPVTSEARSRPSEDISNKGTGPSLSPSSRTLSSGPGEIRCSSACDLHHICM